MKKWKNEKMKKIEKITLQKIFYFWPENPNSQFEKIEKTTFTGRKKTYNLSGKNVEKCGVKITKHNYEYKLPFSLIFGVNFTKFQNRG